MTFHSHLPQNMNFYFQDVVEMQYLNETKHIHYCSKFFNTMYIKFYRNQQSFIKDMTKYFGLLSSWTLCSFIFFKNILFQFY